MKRIVFLVVPVLVTANLFARGGWADPPGDWLYVYEANEGEDAYSSTFWLDSCDPDPAVGTCCLDGTWMRSSNSDQWDGSKPGEQGMAPGGVEVIKLEGEGEDGEDAWVLSIEDTGDPRNFTPAWPDPGNRKIYLAHDVTGQLSLEEGITMCARFRLNPAPVDPLMICDGCPIVGNGMDLHDANKGMLGYAEDGVATISMVIDDFEQLLLLDDEGTVAGVVPISLMGITTEWLTVWLTAQYDSVLGETVVSLYLNGNQDPELDYDEAIFTGIEADFETGCRGIGVTSYINIAAGSTGRDVAWQLDYFCVASGYNEALPDDTNCPSGLSCSVTEDDVQLTWSNREATVTSFAIERNGAVIEPTLAGDQTSYSDPDLGPGTYSYVVTPTVAGEDCDPMECTVSLCPRGLACTVLGQDVTLNWINGGPYETVIKRDGAEVATVPGDQATWSETITEPGDYTYTLNAVGGEGACDDLTCSVTILPAVPQETADFNPPAGGWAYVYDPTPTSTSGDMLMYDPTAGFVGCLDGEWTRSDASDRWDGTAPGDVDTLTDDDLNGELDGAAPGGVGLGVVTAGAPGGAADAGVLSFEDVGDPSDTAFLWDGVVYYWADDVNAGIENSGSNRKIYLGHNFNDVTDDPMFPDALLDTGVTLNVRLRLTPADQVVDFDAAGATAPDGLGPQSNGKGLVTLHWIPETAVATDPVRKLPVFLWGEADGRYWLQVGHSDNEENVIRMYLGNTLEAGTQFVNLWITVERPDDLELIHTVSIYLNGSADLYYKKDVVLAQGEAENAAGSGNTIFLGTMATPEVVGFQLDFIKIAPGVLEPGGQVEPGHFKRGDSNRDGGVNIADAVYVLQNLFASGPDILCQDAADSNDDESVNIADAVYILQNLFASGPPMPAPGPDVCGEDPTGNPTGGADLPKCDYCPEACQVPPVACPPAPAE